MNPLAFVASDVPHKGYQTGNRDSVNGPNWARRLPLSYSSKIVHGRARMTCYRRAPHVTAAGLMAKSPSLIIRVTVNIRAV
jgi:hypothetical protein